ncbi:hypothetical protein DOTSEDRAFT_137782 [Dothistroma septosporum NZE10]|uniref:Uncharacterized protein n=1 Tax=Dothistroma septosporum (strain NZE10 / CBS 128990) TaxID=675120 RepID=N1PDF1_DOTSN|nr:hypothetical protein DOTSEDRAFT_137782 [Dothistroma septosporum NZE10]
MSGASSADSFLSIKPSKRNRLGPSISSPGTPLRLVLVGDPLCGKTAIARRFAYGDFVPVWGQFGAFKYDMALTTDRSGKTIEIDFWDAAGQPEFCPSRFEAYLHLQCILICFSVGMKDSFDNVADVWIQEVLTRSRRVPILLIGYKTNLRASPRNSEMIPLGAPVLMEEYQGVETAASIGAEKYLECSAKDGDGVVQVFGAAIQLALSHRRKERRKRSFFRRFASH